MRHHGRCHEAQKKPSPSPVTKCDLGQVIPALWALYSFSGQQRGWWDQSLKTYYLLPTVGDPIFFSLLKPGGSPRALLVRCLCWLHKKTLTNQSELVHKTKPICDPKIIWFLKPQQLKWNEATENYSHCWAVKSKTQLLAESDCNHRKDPRGLQRGWGWVPCVLDLPPLSSLPSSLSSKCGWSPSPLSPGLVAIPQWYLL